MSKFNFKANVKFSILCLVAVCILITSTYFIMQKNSPQKVDEIPIYSEDFNFKLNFNTFGKEQIDTYKGAFTKDLVTSGTETIKFKISNKANNDIYKMMLDMKIMTFPDDIKFNGIGCTPSCDYKLTVTIDGKTKDIVWKDAVYPGIISLEHKDSIPINNLKFLDLVKYISDYIYSTDEYKSMPKAIGGYD